MQQPSSESTTEATVQLELQRSSSLSANILPKIGNCTSYDSTAKKPALRDKSHLFGPRQGWFDTALALAGGTAWETVPGGPIRKGNCTGRGIQTNPHPQAQHLPLPSTSAGAGSATGNLGGSGRSPEHLPSSMQALLAWGPALWAARGLRNCWRRRGGSA